MGWKSRIWFAIRLGFSVMLLWFAFEPIDWRALLDSGQQLSPIRLIIAFGLILVSNTVAGLRWGWIGRHSGLLQSWRRYVVVYFAGGLINQGLPSTLGGDTYRAVQSARHQRIGEGPALRYGTLCVVLDRGIGLLSNVMLGTLGLILGGLYLTPWAPSAGWALGLAIVSALLLVGALFRTAMVQALLLKLLKLLRLPHGEPAIRSVFAWPGNIGQILTGLSIHLLTLGCFAACLKAYGATVPFEAIMIGMPALTLLMMLPISISGWGLRETTLSAVLLLWDVPASTTVLASISYGLIVALCYLPAAWFLVRNRPPFVTSVTNPSH